MRNGRLFKLSSTATWGRGHIIRSFGDIHYSKTTEECGDAPGSIVGSNGQDYAATVGHRHSTFCNCDRYGSSGGSTTGSAYLARIAAASQSARRGVTMTSIQKLAKMFTKPKVTASEEAADRVTEETTKIIHASVARLRREATDDMLEDVLKKETAHVPE